MMNALFRQLESDKPHHQTDQRINDALGFGGRYKIVNINIQSDFRSYAKTAIAAAPMMARMADTQYEAAAPEMNINEPGTEEIVQTVNGSVQM